jgi:hypothetical protein
MSEIIEPEKDAFGFPIKSKEPKKEQKEIIPWGKIGLVVIIGIAVFFHIFVCIIAGNVCYNDYKDDPFIILTLKVMAAVLFNYFFLIYKGIKVWLINRS